MDTWDNYLELLEAIVAKAATDAADGSNSSTCMCGRSLRSCGRRYVLAVRREATESRDPRDAFMGMVAA